MPNCVNKCTKQPLNQKNTTFIIVKNFLTDGCTKQLQKWKICGPQIHANKLKINVIVQHEYIAFNWTLTGWRASTWGLGERSAPLSPGHGPTAFTQIKSQVNLLTYWKQLKILWNYRLRSHLRYLLGRSGRGFSLYETLLPFQTKGERSKRQLQKFLMMANLNYQLSC